MRKRKKQRKYHIVPGTVQQSLFYLKQQNSWTGFCCILQYNDKKLLSPLMDGLPAEKARWPNNWQKTGYVYIDSGAMYRAVTLYFCVTMLTGRIVPKWWMLWKISILISGIMANRSNPRYFSTMECGICDPRPGGGWKKWVMWQRLRKYTYSLRWRSKKWAQKEVVMDGRDIGTTVFRQRN